MWWNIIAITIIVLLILYLVIEIHRCRVSKAEMVERFEEAIAEAPSNSASTLPLPANACNTLLDPLSSQAHKHQKYRTRLLKATRETNPDLDHENYDYCYVRDFDFNASPDYSPPCDSQRSDLYSNAMVRRVMKADVKDQDSQLNVPRSVCLMEIERDKVNINNVNDFVSDMNVIENAEFMDTMKSYKTEIALLQKNNAELSEAVQDMHVRLADTQKHANKEAVVAKHAQINLTLHQLQLESDTQNKVIIMDGNGSTIHETNTPTSFDMAAFKGEVRSIIIPKHNSFRVIMTTPRGEFTFTRTEMNTSQAGLQVSRIRIL